MLLAGFKTARLCLGLSIGAAAIALADELNVREVMAATDKKLPTMNAPADNSAAGTDAAANVCEAIMGQSKVGPGLIYLTARAARERL